MSEDKKKYIVVCYMKIEPDDVEAMTREEAEKEVEQLSLMQSENIYLIEEFEEDESIGG